MYLPPLVLFNPLWGMNEDIIIFLSQSLSLLLFLFLSLSLNVEPPWEGGGAILGTTPHPTMLLNIYMIPLSIITMSIFITNHHSYHSSSSSSSLTLTLKPSTGTCIIVAWIPFGKLVDVSCHIRQRWTGRKALIPGDSKVEPSK